MSRQAWFRVLLSLLLLVTQQLATTHVLSHLTGNLGTPAGASASAGAKARGTNNDSLALKASLAQDQNCNQCLLFAQMAGSMVSSPAKLDVPHQASFAIAGIAARCTGARAILAFQSRAPPILS